MRTAEQKRWKGHHVAVRSEPQGSGRRFFLLFRASGFSFRFLLLRVKALLRRKEDSFLLDDQGFPPTWMARTYHEFHGENFLRATEPRLACGRATGGVMDRKVVTRATAIGPKGMQDPGCPAW